MHQLLETRAMLEPSQGHVMFYHEVGTGWPVSGVWLEEIGR